MNPIQKRLIDINEELSALRDTLDATATEITTLGDDLTNITRIGRHLREIGTIAHSYDGVTWLGDVLGVDPGTWAEARDDERRAVSRLEDTIRDRRKSLKTTTDEIKRGVSALEREREAITRAERVIGGTNGGEE